MKISKLTLLETNVDDCSPELISWVMERVMEEGALDIHVIPCVMKKGRLGYLIRVLTQEPEKFTKLLMQETKTLGVRAIDVERVELERETRKIKIDILSEEEEIGIKKSKHGIKPEFEDVRRLAKKHEVAYWEMDEIIREKLKNSDSGDLPITQPR